MLYPLLIIAAAISFPAEAQENTGAPAAGTQWTYRGSVAALGADRALGDPEKKFDLTLLLAANHDGWRKLYWTLEERGRGAWPWTRRFGSLALDKAWKKAGNDAGIGPSLLYDLGDSKTDIPLPLPFFAADEPLAASRQWSAGPWQYEVQGAKKFEGRDTWQVQVSNSYGPKRTLWVDKQGPQVAGIDERVFMGMGQEYQLQLRIVGSETLADQKLQETVAGFEALAALRAGLNVSDGSEALNLNAQQLALLAERLPGVEKQVTGEPLKTIVKAAGRDLGTQSNLAEAINKLVAQHLGKQVDAFSIQTLSGEKVSQARLQDKITVLHFWDYRDTPLKEPYGQVGYLDFLYQRRQADGVQVYGVAIDGRLADESQRGPALRGIRKLQSFMNLSYPILLDAGSLIKQFGDPRLAGAELPLFVVIGRDGRIVHYRVGLYEVDRNEGLKELNAIVTAALK